jgi:hypothetical protein
MAAPLLVTSAIGARKSLAIGQNTKRSITCGRALVPGPSGVCRKVQGSHPNAENGVLYKKDLKVGGNLQRHCDPAVISAATECETLQCATTTTSVPPECVAFRVLTAFSRLAALFI